MKDVIVLTREQVTRYDVLRKAMGGVVVVKESAEALGLSDRQIKRLKKEVEENGVEALIHGNKGRTSKHKVSEKTKEDIVKLKRSEVYAGSNFKHFQEKLAEKHEIEIGCRTLYKLLTGAGIQAPKTRRRRKEHRRRKRRAHTGMLLQTDATPYSQIMIYFADRFAA
jgi:transposase